LEAAIATGIRADYPSIALRTRVRRRLVAGCHTPGCRHRAAAGKSFCSDCQATLDKVRIELAATKGRGRKPTIRKAA
jgi:hypothetical protein